MAYLAAPNGLDLGALLKPFSFGDESGVGWLEALVDRGRSSSLRLPICGVGGTEPVAAAT